MSRFKTITCTLPFICVLALTPSAQAQGSSPTVLTLHEGPSSAEDNTLQSLHRKRLWEKQRWQRLLHRHPSWFGSTQNRMLSDSFFISPEGAEDPYAELLASLYALQSNSGLESDQHAQCKYPARFRFLQRELPHAQFPRARCPQLNIFLTAWQRSRLSIIYMPPGNSPRDAVLGDLMLRLGSQEKGNQLLDLTLRVRTLGNGKLTTSSASAPSQKTESWLKRMVRLQAQPYYRVFQDSPELLKREIWELTLNLRRDEIEWIFLALWEIENASLTQGLLDDLSAAHLLNLLQMARPQFQLSRIYPFFFHPVDLVQALYDNDGLVLSTTYKPSSFLEFARQRAGMGENEEQALTDLLRSRAPSWESLDVQSREKVLSAGLNYFEHELKTAALSKENSNKIVALRSKRAKLLNMSEKPLGKMVRESDSPRATLLSSLPYRHKFAVSWLGSLGRKQTVQLRPSVGFEVALKDQDFKSPVRLDHPDLHLTIIDLKTSVLSEEDRFVISDLTIFHLLSSRGSRFLVSWPPVSQLAWEVDASWTQMACTDYDDYLSAKCGMAGLSGGLGIGIQPSLLSRIVIMPANVRLGWHDAQGAFLSYGPRLKAWSDLWEGSRLAVASELQRRTTEMKGDYGRFNLSTSVHLSQRIGRNLEFRGGLRVTQSTPQDLRFSSIYTF